MPIFKRLCVVLCSTLLLFTLQARGQAPFLVKAIHVQGLQRITLQTTLSYMPVHVGEILGAQKADDTVRRLYQTGFFSNVRLSREGNTLIVQVSERPTIGLIKISGNKQIKKADLMKALNHADIVEGQTYKPNVLEAMQHALLNEYHRLGHYGAKVFATATPQSRNRVLVTIAIQEGKIAKITQIHIIGNQAFSTKRLLNLFSLGKKHWWAFFSTKDHYTGEKLQKDLQSLPNFYLDRGYLRFKMDAPQVNMTPDKRAVVLTLRVTEGVPYHLSGYTVSGDLLKPVAPLYKRIDLKKGQLFSRAKILRITRSINKMYAEQGYAKAQTRVIPRIDDLNHTVFLTFKIQSGPRTYVRYIDYTGNTKTEDVVLRRETRQMEGGIYVPSKQIETKRRLANLGYLENIDYKAKPIPNKTDQLDVGYTAKESSSTTATAQFGYSDAYGFLYGANITQRNFKGSGKTVALGFNNSQDVQTYTFSYFNPYYTDSGMSRGVSVYFQKMTPDQNNVASYDLDSYGAMMKYRMPISEYSYLSFGYGYEYLEVKANSFSYQINHFIKQYGSHFNNLKVIGGWTRNTYDRIMLPTSGTNQWLGLEVGLPGLPDSLEYYRASYDAALYQPIRWGFILKLSSNLGYGNGYGRFAGDLPFFKNYYAGGMGTVRGFEASSLGPKDSLGNALGGSVLTAGSINLILPGWVNPSHLRSALFFDAGNVYNLGVAFSDLRYSAGLQIDWASPVGLLKISFGEALNSKVGDNLRFINFSVGSGF